MNGRTERRAGFPPVPHGIEQLLTELQAASLREFDWRFSIAFVRSQERAEALVVVRDDYVGSYGVLSDDGIVYYDLGLKFRA